MKMIVVRCTEQITVNNITFRTGEEYTAGDVNGRWWIVDSVGFTGEDFNLHFEVMEERPSDNEFTEDEASAPAYRRPVNWSEPDFTEEWLSDGERKNDKEKTSFLGRLKEWYDNWEIIQWQYENGL